MSSTESGLLRRHARPLVARRTNVSKALGLPIFLSSLSIVCGCNYGRPTPGLKNRPVCDGSSVTSQTAKTKTMWRNIACVSKISRIKSSPMANGQCCRRWTFRQQITSCRSHNRLYTRGILPSRSPGNRREFISGASARLRMQCQPAIGAVRTVAGVEYVKKLRPLYRFWRFDHGNNQ